MRRIFAIAAFVLSMVAGPAEQYLSIADAQKLCFPKAERFEAQVARFTPEQAKAVEKRTRGKVLNKGNRFWMAFGGTNYLGMLVMDQVLGKHEIIDYAVAISPEGKVLQIEILEYRESHGYEIRSQRWRDQFKGKTADSKLKLNDDISNLSGATISCRQVTDGVKRVLATYEVVLRPLAGTGGGLQKPAR